MNNQNAGRSIRQLDFVFIGLLALQLVLLVTAYFIVSSEMIIIVNLPIYILQLVVMFENLSAIVAANFLFNLNSKNALKKESSGEKLKLFFNASILRLALISGSSIMDIVFYLITGEYLFALLALLLMALLFIYRPSLYQLKNNFLYV